jgi:hypothetical protein
MIERFDDGDIRAGLPDDPGRVTGPRIVAPTRATELSVGPVARGGGSRRHDPDDPPPLVAFAGHGWRHDAQQQRIDDEIRRHRPGPRIAPNRLGGLRSADSMRIPGPSRLGHSPDSTPLTLPGGDSSGTLPLILHECLTGRPGHRGPRTGRQAEETRRRRGVGVVASRPVPESRRNGGHQGLTRESSGQASRDDAGRGRQGEQALLPNRTCYGTSCDRGLHERPMKMKVVRRVGEGFRSRPVLSSGAYVPGPSASYDKGVGRTRP